MFKVNFDGALNRGDEICGTGAVIRDFYGHIIGDHHDTAPCVTSAAIAEGHAAIKALKFAKGYWVATYHS